MKRKKLALIHTVSWYSKAITEPFVLPWLKTNPGVEIINIMDDSLLAESVLNGKPTKNVIRRMINYFLAAEASGADVIMSTCTTMGEATRIARKFINIPAFNIDEPMAREAVSKGKVLGILATVPTSAPATRYLLEAEANEVQKDIVIKTIIDEEAFRHLMKDEINEHNELVYMDLEKLQKEVDVIVLGQVSLSQIKYMTTIPMLQVGHSGFSYASELLDCIR